MNFETARTKMVDNQIRPCDVTSHSVLNAFLSLPREEFLPEDERALAYLDRDHALSQASAGNPGRWMLNPAMLAKLVQLCAADDGDVVLVVGAGYGYTPALFSQLASSVVAIEEDAALEEIAGENLSRLGYDNVAVLHGSFAEGWEREAPYDVIFVEGSVEFVPRQWIEQLAEGGRLVVVEGLGKSAQAKVYFKSRGVVGVTPHFNCAAPVLPGFNTVKEFAL